MLRLYLIYLKFYFWEPFTHPPKLGGIITKNHQQLVSAVLGLLGVPPSKTVSFQT
jgi:hypothetical protein